MVGDLLYQVWTGDSADDEVLAMVVRTGTSAFAFQLFLCLALCHRLPNSQNLKSASEPHH